jgi:sugar phosphate isomerase/epimerase
MPRPLCLFTGQWADLPLEKLAEKAKQFGYDGLELCCWGDHFDVPRALADKDYVRRKWELLSDHGLTSLAISSHLVGQATCDRIDERHKAILPERIWKDGDPEGVRTRAAAEMADTARAARRFFSAAPKAVKDQLKKSGRTVVVGFTGSPIWHLNYSFPPVLPRQIERGYAEFARRWTSILKTFEAEDVCFALEVHPTEIAFDLASARRALEALGNQRRFGFNFDPSHFGYQGADYLGFVQEFGTRIWNVHVKDVHWASRACPVGVFGGHTDFGAPGRYWDFRSPGRGRIDFEGLIRALHQVRYQGPLTVEWEDPQMDREHGAREAAEFVRRLDFPCSELAFDKAFERKSQGRGSTRRRAGARARR